MPKLSTRDYLAIRRFLARLWDEGDGKALAALPGYAQPVLHDYFAPTLRMTDRYAPIHRQQMIRPSILAAEGWP